MVRRSYALGVWRVSSIVKVHLGSSLVHGRCQHLFGVLLATRARTNHPYQQHDEDDKDDGSGNTARNVGKLGTFEAAWSGEGALAAARRCTLEILDADA